MTIMFEDSETAIVTIPAAVVEEQSGNCILDGTKIITFSLGIPHHPSHAPEVKRVETAYSFPVYSFYDTTIGLIAVGDSDKYRIDDDGVYPHDALYVDIAEEWWKLYGEEYYTWQPATETSTGEWRPKK